MKEEKEKLYKAASQPDGYKIYSSLFSFLIEKWTPPEALAKKMERYLRASAWKARDGQISTSISCVMGIVYITFRRAGDVLKVDLSEIEKT